MSSRTPIDSGLTCHGMPCHDVEPQNGSQMS